MLSVVNLPTTWSPSPLYLQKYVLPEAFSISVDGSSSFQAAHVKSFGGLLDFYFFLIFYIQTISEFYWFYIQNICRIQPLLSTSTDTTVEWADGEAFL